MGVYCTTSATRASTGTRNTSNYTSNARMVQRGKQHTHALSAPLHSVHAVRRARLGGWRARDGAPFEFNRGLGLSAGAARDGSCRNRRQSTSLECARVTNFVTNGLADRTAVRHNAQDVRFPATPMRRSRYPENSKVGTVPNSGGHSKLVCEQRVMMRGHQLVSYVS